MDSLSELQLAIEKLRGELHAMVEAKGGRFSDPEVTEMSERLDKLIVRYEQIRALREEKRD